MIPEFGHICLIVAGILSLWQGFAVLAPRGTPSASRLPAAKSGALVGMLLIAASFAALVYSHAASDFSVVNVYENSHSAQPLIYRITGSWGSHEGSMMLFAFVLAGYGGLLALLPCLPAMDGVRARALAVLAWLMAGLVAFILLTSNPFVRLYPVPLEGQALNPLLQDIGLAMHPPMLYLGYVGFGVAYALTLGALLESESDLQAYARLIRPWVLIPWSLLGWGIGLGSWWAYRELGWGGWWFWDPVENASLLPWLSATALLHSVAVCRKTGRLPRWVMLLSILTFLLSLTGTFLVRSGVLTSVHSFASDPKRGLFILAYLIAVGMSALLVFTRRFPPGAREVPMAFLTRGGMILFNNLLTLVACASILLAMLYPLALDALGLRPVSVGAPYYNQVIVPMLAPLLLLAGSALLLPWPAGGARIFIRKAWPLALVATGGIAASVIFHWLPWPNAVFAGLGGWLILASLRSLWPLPIDRRRLGGALAHGGLGLLALSAAISLAGQLTSETAMSGGETRTIDGWQVTLGQPKSSFGPNYASLSAEVTIDTGRSVISLSPEERRYPSRGTTTQEAAIHHTLLRDIYAVIRTPPEGHAADPLERRAILRLYSNPWMQPLWIAIAMIGAGGALAAASRRKG